MTECVGCGRAGGWSGGQVAGWSWLALACVQLETWRRAHPLLESLCGVTLKSLLVAAARFYSINNSRKQPDRADVLRGPIGDRCLCRCMCPWCAGMGRTSPAQSICAPKRTLALLGLWPHWLIQPCEWFAMHTAAPAEAP